MSDLRDVARVGYIVNNYDLAAIAVDDNGNRILSERFSNRDNTHTSLLKLEKQVDWKYYTTLAVPDRQRKTLWIGTAYITKGVAQVTTANGHALTSKTNLDITPN